MNQISRRINTIEKKLRTGKHQEQAYPPIIITLQTGRNITAEDRQELGPTETWITYQEQLQAIEKDNAEYMEGRLPPVAEIELNVDSEYQARATKSNQKQPKPEKLSLQNE